ncbi:flagellar biosynthetic protein FliO [Legionella genomosp. 1]|nr:flagellar biosynthetic protein FliO [Legionella genomosp. 1]
MKLASKGLYLYLFLSNTAYAAGSEGSSLNGGDFFRILMGLLFVIIFILGLFWLMKQTSRLGTGKHINLEVIYSANLGPRERVLLVRAGTRYLLLGVTSHNITTLCDFGEELPPGFEKQAETRFTEFFKQALRTKSQ